MPTLVSSISTGKPTFGNSVTSPPLISKSFVSAPVSANTGSALGNALRDIAATVSDGHFGQGVMQKQATETTEQYQNRLIKGLGAAAETFQNSSKTPSTSDSMADSFKAGVTTEAITNAIKKFAPIAVIGGVGFLLAKKIIFNKKGARRRTY